MSECCLGWERIGTLLIKIVLSFLSQVINGWSIHWESNPNHLGQLIPLVTDRPFPTCSSLLESPGWWSCGSTTRGRSGLLKNSPGTLCGGKIGTPPGRMPFCVIIFPMTFIASKEVVVRNLKLVFNTILQLFQVNYMLLDIELEKNDTWEITWDFFCVWKKSKKAAFKRFAKVSDEWCPSY